MDLLEAPWRVSDTHRQQWRVSDTHRLEPKKENLDNVSGIQILSCRGPESYFLENISLRKIEEMNKGTLL